MLRFKTLKAELIHLRRKLLLQNLEDLLHTERERDRERVFFTKRSVPYCCCPDDDDDNDNDNDNDDDDDDDDNITP